MDEFRKITIKKTLKVNNPTNYELIGKGVQGAVFKLSEDQCVKMYAKEKYCLSESKALEAGQCSSIIPKVFEVGENYIVMEYIKGQSLKSYLQSQSSIPEAIVKQLVFIFKEMKRIGFTRIDASIRHIILTDDGEIKVIDHVNSMKVQQAWPIRLFTGLFKFGKQSTFLDQVKELDSELYLEWTTLMNKTIEKAEDESEVNRNSGT